MMKITRLLGFEIQRRKSRSWPRTQTQDLGRFLLFKKTFDIAKKAEGDVVECGVGYGRSLAMLLFLAGAEHPRRNVWGFDSFEGFPEPTAEDNSHRNPQKGEWSGISPALLRKTLIDRGFAESFLDSRLKIGKGFFADTLPGFNGRIAILHLDCDIYGSYRTALEELYPKVSPGGVIIFDEYQSASFPGATKAIDEYLGSRPSDIRRDEISGRHYLVK